MIALLLPLAASAQFAYASNEKDGTISVIDTAKDEVVGSIKAGKTPRGMAASVDGKRLYVSDQKSNALRIIDLASRSAERQHRSRRIARRRRPFTRRQVDRGRDRGRPPGACSSTPRAGKVAFKVKVEGENPEHAVFSPGRQVGVRQRGGIAGRRRDRRRRAQARRIDPRRQAAARHRLHARRHSRLRRLRNRQHGLRDRRGQPQGARDDSRRRPLQRHQGAPVGTRGLRLQRRRTAP